MYKIFFSISLLLINVYCMSSEKLYKCENGFSYKINNNKNKSFFKKQDEIWKEIKKVNYFENKYELFIPNNTYLSCSNKSLPTCTYSLILIDDPINKNISVKEVVLNDCYIGTMGCNKYDKGLELNLRRCKIVLTD